MEPSQVRCQLVKRRAQPAPSSVIASVEQDRGATIFIEAFHQGRADAVEQRRSSTSALSNCSAKRNAPCQGAGEVADADRSIDLMCWERPRSWCRGEEALEVRQSPDRDQRFDTRWCR